MPSTSAGERGTITSGKNLLASIIIYGQLKSNDLLKEGDALPASTKLLTRDLIAGIARTQKPECTAELVRDVLHYRSRKARSLFKEFHAGKLRGETPLAERLIEAEKALLNSLEPEANIPNDFMNRPGIPANCIELFGRMREFVLDSDFRHSLLQTLPPPPPSESRPTAASPPKEEEAAIKNDQESHSDGESVHASSSSSYEEQSTEQPPFVSNGFVHHPPNAQPLTPSIDARTGGPAVGRSSTAKKRRLDDGRLEVVELKKDLLRTQQLAFERQVQMCEEMMATMREMRSFIELQRLNTPLLSTPMPPPANPVPQLSSYLQPSLIPPPLSTNLSSLSSFLAHAADPHQPLL